MISLSLQLFDFLLQIHFILFLLILLLGGIHLFPYLIKELYALIHLLHTSFNLRYCCDDERVIQRMEKKKETNKQTMKRNTCQNSTGTKRPGEAPQSFRAPQIENKLLMASLSLRSKFSDPPRSFNMVITLPSKGFDC